MRVFIRSLLFNITFYIYTAVLCFSLVFTFALPRKIAFHIVRNTYFRGIGVLERIFLGLSYRVTGQENLPKDRSYILALKHYSTYETLKLPVIFGDIAIILKRELSWIPFWGWYTLKLGMIPVDRGAKGKAIASLIEGGKRVIAENRPILIFPQGTRVAPGATTAQKPYKVGAAKVAEVLKLPVVPVALNSGAFWPKHSFLKRGGTVDFKILPPIPAGLPATEILKRLEDVLEPESSALMKKPAYGTRKRLPFLLRMVRASIISLFVMWSVLWFGLAHVIKDQAGQLPAESISSPYRPQVSGYPGQMHIVWPQVSVTTQTGKVDMRVLDAKIWPLPGGTVSVSAPAGFTLHAERLDQAVRFDGDSAAVHVTLPRLWQPPETWAIHLTGIALTSGEFALNGTGSIDIPAAQQPGAPRRPVNGVLDMNVAGYAALLKTLEDSNLVNADQARMTKGFFDAMAVAQGQRGALAFPLRVQDDVVYAGFIRLMSLNDLSGADMQQPEPGSAQQRQRIHFGGSGIDAPPGVMRQTPPPAEQPLPPQDFVPDTGMPAPPAAP